MRIAFSRSPKPSDFAKADLRVLLCVKRAQHDVRALNLKRGLRLHEGREVLQVAQQPGVSQKESHLLAPFEGGRPLLLFEREEEIH